MNDHPLCPTCKNEMSWKEVFFYRWNEPKPELLFASYYCERCKYFPLRPKGEEK
jgi:hypothetical protein